MTRREYEEHRQTLAALRVLLARIERDVGAPPPPLKLVKEADDA
jgi:hypothetical protein